MINKKTPIPIMAPQITFGSSMDFIESGGRGGVGNGPKFAVPTPASPSPETIPDIEQMAGHY